ncbi:hypothetical protein ACH4SP_21915 [Streptomyces sp. NPDC021093]|uniref:hypothetical protein n=1 Tax=Streptomyces sp. NPDC021093 TaxID=3365112 RepID=UPI003795903F
MPTPTKADVPALARLARTQQNLVTARQLHTVGLAASTARRRSAPGGPWQCVLPRVYLMQPLPPTPAQRALAAVLYAAGPNPRPLNGRSAAVTAETALFLRGVRDARPAPVDVLVHHTRDIRSTAFVRVHRTRRYPPVLLAEGVPSVRAVRAAADFAGREPSPTRVRALLANAAQKGLFHPEDLLAELRAAKTLHLPPAAAAATELLAGIRSFAEAQARDLLLATDLPVPLWNPTLHTPQGTFLAVPDAYWPDHGVALEVDSQEFHFTPTAYQHSVRRRLRLEAHGVEVVTTTPATIRDQPEVLVGALRAKLEQGEGRGVLLGVRVTPG